MYVIHTRSGYNKSMSGSIVTEVDQAVLKNSSAAFSSKKQLQKQLKCEGRIVRMAGCRHAATHQNANR